MQITVKAVKVLSKGTNDYGDWKLVKVTTDDEKYTTLAKEAEMLTPGTVINITNMDEDDKGKKFKKYEIMEKGPASQTKPPGEMTNEMWDEKAKIERDSIESQTRAERITELWIAGKITDDDSLVTKLRAWLEKLGSQLAAKADPTEKKAPVPPNGKAPPKLKNIEELTARGAKFGISIRDICEAVGVGHPEDIIDLDGAWAATAKKFAGTIKAFQESQK